MRSAVTSALVLLFALPVEAQDVVLVVVENGAPEGRVRAWTERVEATIGGRPTTLASWAIEREPIDSIDPTELAVLEQIEALLIEARANAIRLEERAALNTLARAEDLAERHFDLPGMSAWYAEVQLAIAVTASQAEMSALAEAALTRAASVDPSRAVQMGEARPELVERSRAAVRAAAVGPRGRFELVTNAGGARAFLDDRPLGVLPRTVEVARGPHVLRIEAPGHLPWADVVEVLEGERPEVRVDLSPAPLRTRAMALEAAAREGDLDAVRERLAAVADAPPISILFVGAGTEDRALVVTCAPECSARRLEREHGETSDVGLAADLEWLGAPADRPPPTPWWEEWYVWVAAGGAALAVAAAIITVAAQPQGEGRLILEVDARPVFFPGVD